MTTATAITINEARREALGLARDLANVGPEMMETALERLGRFEGMKIVAKLAKKYGRAAFEDGGRVKAAEKAAKRIEREIGRELDGRELNAVACGCVNQIMDME